jgi:hypothetical protein
MKKAMLAAVFAGFGRCAASAERDRAAIGGGGAAKNFRQPQLHRQRRYRDAVRPGDRSSPENLSPEPTNCGFAICATVGKTAKRAFSNVFRIAPIIKRPTMAYNL